MTRSTLTAAARRAMFNHLACDPDATATNLAEAAAITLGHDEWLDDPDHWIWDLALELGDQVSTYPPTPQQSAYYSNR